MSIQVFYYGYYALLVFTFLLFLLYRKYEPRLLPLGYLLAFSILAEGTVEYLIRHQAPYYYVYHFFGPIEYVCISLFFRPYLPAGRLRKAVVLFIPLFVVASLVLSFDIIRLHHYQGFNTSLRGFLLIVLSLVTLFTLPYEKGRALYRLPVFWIAVAIMLYYGGVFFMNGIYNGLQQKYPSEKVYYQRIHNIINIIFNYLYYSLFCMAFICSKQDKK